MWLLNTKFHTSLVEFVIISSNDVKNQKDGHKNENYYRISSEFHEIIFVNK